jgi:hypothetical protein
VSLTAPTTVSATTVSAITGGCPTIGAPQREHTRAMAGTSAAHSRHLIWVMMAYGLSPAGGVGWIVTSWRARQAKCSHLDHRPSAGLLIAGVTGTSPQPKRARCRTATRYLVLRRCVEPSALGHDLDYLESFLTDQMADTLLDGIDFDDFDWTGGVR